jgi:hypothetical protein
MSPSSQTDTICLTEKFNKYAIGCLSQRQDSHISCIAGCFWSRYNQRWISQYIWLINRLWLTLLPQCCRACSGYFYDQHFSHDIPPATTSAPSINTSSTNAPSTTTPSAIPDAASDVAPGLVHVPVSVTLFADSDEEQDFTNDKDAANAGSSLADAPKAFFTVASISMCLSTRRHPCIILRGVITLVFSRASKSSVLHLSYWLNLSLRYATGPKVLGVSRIIFHKVDTVEQGIVIVKRTIMDVVAIAKHFTRDISLLTRT